MAAVINCSPAALATLDSAIASSSPCDAPESPCFCCEHGRHVFEKEELNDDDKSDSSTATVLYETPCVEECDALVDDPRDDDAFDAEVLLGADDSNHVFPRCLRVRPLPEDKVAREPNNETRHSPSTVAGADRVRRQSHIRRSVNHWSPPRRSPRLAPKSANSLALQTRAASLRLRPAASLPPVSLQ